MSDSIKNQTDQNAKNNATIESDAFKSPHNTQNASPSPQIEPDAGEDLSSEALLNDECPEKTAEDLNDSDEFELVLEDESTESHHSGHRQDAKKRMLSLEIARQKGVEIHGNRVTVPGRVALTPITLFAILLSVLGFAGAFIHFSIFATNYLLAVLVIEFIVFVQIIIYHSSYRARRTTMGVLHILGCIAVIGLMDWAYLDIIQHPKNPEHPHALLAAAAILYTCIPLLLVIHLVYLGRGKREILIKRKKTQADKPTKIIKTKPEQTEKVTETKPEQSTLNQPHKGK